MPAIECIPNVSEGRRPDVVTALAGSLTRSAGVRLLDYSADRAHNRSVFTLAGSAAGIEQAVLALYACALAHIDLRVHRGEHPRIGAVDVVPLVPLERATMTDCVALARRLGAAIAERFAVPVYLYEEAATSAARRNLADIRRGGFEGLGAKMARPEWAPDFGPRAPHPSAGASAVGARRPLIAYNINLATDRIDIARAIAARIRERGGGLPAVKALGIRLGDRGLVQVSTNLTNYEVTPLQAVFDAVRAEAERHGVTILESEIVGLAPAAALAGTTAGALRLTPSSAGQVLEDRLKG
jgi:glutamate formiminotransferase